MCIRDSSIIVPSLVYSAIGTNGTDTNYDIVATNVVNLDGVSTPANVKPFVTTTTGAGITYGGALLGGLNQGFTNSYTTGSNNKAPLLAGAALADFNLGGAVSVQSKGLDDDASHAFDSRFYFTSRGLFTISVDFEYTTQGLFACGSNQVHKLAASSGDLFEVSTTGSNPDVDGKFNVWFTGGKVNVKNRLGSFRVATLTFMG